MPRIRLRKKASLVRLRSGRLAVAVPLSSRMARRVASRMRSSGRKVRRR